MTPHLTKTPDGVRRCFWCGTDPLYVSYHDEEWGRPVGDDRRLFEKIVLEGFQSGLSWLTILRKRENFRRAFDDFDIEKVARYDQRKVRTLLADAGIVRHRGKIDSAINNAKRASELVDKEGSIAALFWRYEPPPSGRPKRLTWEVLKTMSRTTESVALAKELKRRGWSFVGPTTLYAAMQAMGVVNDHLHGCTHRDMAERDRSAFRRPA